MDSAGNAGGSQSTEVVWSEYQISDSIAVGNGSVAQMNVTTPVQIQLGSADIVKQINQQMPLQVTVNSQGQVVLQPFNIAVQNHQVDNGLVAGPAAEQPVAIGSVSSIVTNSSASSQPAQAAPNSGVPLITVGGNVLQAGTDHKVKAKARVGSGRVECDVCKKTFSCAANLKDHSRLHTGEKPYKCSECNMEFTQRSNWRLHKRIHTGEKPYMCGICGKTFARSSHLPGHVRIHTGERPFKCDVCNHSFPSSQALKNHKRTHTGEKPYKCEFCETAFTHSSSLSSHKKKCNGEKRKRGRPIGTGKKALKKKQPSGRPRGRPKKKLRPGRGRKKLKVDNCDQSNSTEDDLITKSEGIYVAEFPVIERKPSICDAETLIVPDIITKEEVIVKDSPLNHDSNGSSYSSKQQTSKKISNDREMKAVRESARLRLKQKKVDFYSEENSDKIAADDSRTSPITSSRVSVVESTQESLVPPYKNLTTTSLKYEQPMLNKLYNNSVITPQQQEAALAMTNLQQGVLNLTQTQHPSAVTAAMSSIGASAAMLEQSPIVTFVTPIDLHNNAAIPTEAIRVPLVAHQPMSTIPINLNALHDENNQQQHYISCHVNGSEVRVPVSEVISARPSGTAVVTSLSSHW